MHESCNCGDSMEGAKTYRKVALVRAKQIDRQFIVKTPHGLVVGEPGDYLCESADGTDRWPCKKEIFEKTYEEVVKRVDVDLPPDDD